MCQSIMHLIQAEQKFATASTHSQGSLQHAVTHKCQLYGYTKLAMFFFMLKLPKQSLNARSEHNVCIVHWSSELFQVRQMVCYWPARFGPSIVPPAQFDWQLPKCYQATHTSFPQHQISVLNWQKLPYMLNMSAVCGAFSLHFHSTNVLCFTDSN